MASKGFSTVFEENNASNILKPKVTRQLDKMNIQIMHP